MLRLPRISLLVVATLLFAACPGPSNDKPDASTPAKADAISLTPSEASIPAGSNAVIHADVTLEGNPATDADPVKWSVDDSSIATLAASGANVTVKAVKPGSTRVTATSGDVTATATITVTDPEITQIAISPSPGTVAAGLIQALKATGVFTDGHTADVTEQLTWTSSLPDIARVEDTVGNKGKVTGVAIGTAKITASAGSVSSSVNFLVTAPVLTAITVTPANPTVSLGRTQQLTATGAFSDGSSANITSQVVWTSGDSLTVDVSTGGLAKGKAKGTATINASKDGVTGSTDVTVTDATIVFLSITSSGSSSIPKGLTRQLTAIATMSDSTQLNVTSQVTWATTDATVATISSSGLVNAVAQGSATITAALNGSSTTYGVTVTAPNVVSIAVSPSTPTVAKGLTQAFTAQATYTDNSTGNVTSQVTWTSSNTTIATITAAGVATAKAVGASTISAAIGNVSGTTMMQVTAAQVVSIAVTPANPSVAKGLTQQYVATATYTDATTSTVTTQVTWSTADNTVATISNTTGSKGLATAAGVGSTQVTATLGTISGNAAITVTPPTVTSIAVTPTNPSVAKGLTKQFTATATYTDATTSTVTTQATWTSANQTVATIDANGLASTLATGTSTITASFGGKSSGTTLTVTAAQLASIAISPSTATIAKGLTQTFTATGTNTDGTTTSVTASANWTSSDTNVATVGNTSGSKGVATSVNQGTATITATVGTISGTATLNVGPKAVTGITLSPQNVTVLPGASVQYTVTASYTDGTTGNATSQASWQSSNTAAATIDSNGLATAVADGSTTITATVNGFTATSTLNVNSVPVTLVSIAVSPTNPNVAKGLTQQFTATGTYSDSTTQDLTAQANWTSSDTNVATISNTAGSQGLATTLNQGPTTITAMVGSVSGTATLNVNPAAVSSVAITPANPTIAQGATQQFTATATYTDGFTSDVTAQASWASSLTSVATIDPATGLATGVGGGTTTITGTFGAKSGNTALTVTTPGPTIVSIAVAPVDPSVAINTGLQLKAVATMSDSSTQDVTSQVTWSSATPANATVSASGYAIAVAAGSSTMTASLSGKSGTTNFTVNGSTCHLVINEVSVAGSGGSADEFVEIYNPCSASIDAKNYTLQYQSAGGPSDTLAFTFPSTNTPIAANGFFLIKGQGFTGAGDGTLSGTSSGLLAAAGGGVGLKNASAVVVDSMGYGTATNAYVKGSAATVPPSGSSDIRYPFDGKDSQVNNADFKVSSLRTPRAANQ